MKKNKFYPLGGTTVFLVDQWAKHYVEKNLKMGEKRKLTNWNFDVFIIQESVWEYLRIIQRK